ncbi:MAG: GNAT family N-acetyltransferase [Dehalococcoidia bacterium]|nr:GNAT family N-acetyltransferase [Dehalococcoidia bacterium]
MAYGDIRRVRLTWDSRFTAATLSSHLEEYPRLVLWNPATGEYVVGGYWRGRRDIGLLIEVSKGPNQALLVDRLVSRFQEEEFRAVVLSQDEVEGGGDWYLKHGWGLLDRLLVFQLRLSRFQLEAENDLRISHFQPRELAALMELDREAFPWLWWNEPADFIAYSSSRNVAIFLARVDGRLLGYASYSVKSSRGHLDRLAVHPSIGRKGCGSELLAFILKRMWESGIRDVGLTTQESNRVAQELYRRFGFSETGEVHEILGLELLQDGN